MLRPRERRTLEALARRIAPAAYDGSGFAVDLAAAVEERLATVDRVRAPDVRRILSLFDHPVTAGLLHGSPVRFSRAQPDVQDARLRAWAQSRIPLRRTIYQAFRRLILSTYYALPGAQAEIGYRPLGLRGPEVAWEGPLPGVPSGQEPILRRSDPGEWRPPPISGMGAGDVPTGVVRGRAVDRDLALAADVCVIGTGAGGAVAAERLTAAGLDVVMLEAGGYWPPASFTDDEGEMMTRLYADQASRSTDDLAVQILQGECVGGSTLVNWMMTLRTPDWVLDEWADEHGTEGMRPADLGPVFERVEREIHAGAVPDDAHAPNNAIILNGARALGWRARAAVNNAVGCVRAGTCGLGCRYDAKQSTLAAYIPHALARGARLYADATVHRLEVVEPGHRGRKRVHARVASGEQRHALTVEAPTVVLAAGAVGTPIILQRSGMGGGGVGRFLRLHPTTGVAGRFGREIRATAGVPQSALCDEFLRESNGYGFWIECPATSPALASTAVPGFGAAHREAMTDFRNLGILIALTRDGVVRGQSYGSVGLRRDGRPSLRYRLPPEDCATVLRSIDAAARMLFAAGAERVQTLHEPPQWIASAAELGRGGSWAVGPNRLGLYSAHVNGTCRMGTDPATSGCTPDGERHGVPGVYVADGSLMPTAPAVNPQLTIMALAAVIAERIA